MADDALTSAAPEAAPEALPPVQPAPEPPAAAPEAKPESKDPAMAARDRIARARSDTVRDEAKAPVAEESQPAPAGDAEQPSAAGPTSEGEAAPVSPTNDQQPEPKRFKLKVNGAEKEVTEEELIAAAQRQIAGEDAFRRAAALRQGGAPAQAPTPQSAGAQPENPKPAPSPAPSAGPSSDQIKAWAKDIAYGDEEKVAAALDGFRAAVNVPANASNEDVTAQINRAMAVNRTIDAQRSAWTKVGEEYSGVRDDPYLLGVAENMAAVEAGATLARLGIYTPEQLLAAPRHLWLQRLYEAHTMGWPVDIEQVYREGAKGAWERYGRPEPQPQTAAVSHLAERREQKAGAIQPPRPQNVSANTPAPQQQTPADVVAAMKRQRGL